jgi:trans-aconitate 2-methyltransferase
LLIERFRTRRDQSTPRRTRQARERLPRCTFVEGDLSTWMPEQSTDLLFGNAVFHWVPDHPRVLARLLQSLSPGGMLAVQMPDNTTEPALMLMEKVAASARGPPRSRRPVGRATSCRARGTTTICCGHCAAASTSGTPITIT